MCCSPCAAARTAVWAATHYHIRASQRLIHGFFFILLLLSQGAEISQPPQVGIEPGPQDLKTNTLLRRCKRRLLQQGCRSVLYAYTYYIFPCFKLIRPRIYSEPRCYSGTLHPDARNTSRGPHIPATKYHRVQKYPNRPRWESNLDRRI